MRNLFDQYSQPENRLTHSLAVCLDEDRVLLRKFLKWLGVAPAISASKLQVVEQRLPGDPPDSEEEAERKGLPDIVIHDREAWALLIESKIQAALTDDQLRRHERTLFRRDFRQVHKLALTKGGTRAPRGVIERTWSDLYEWLGGSTIRGEWSERLRAYLRAAENRLSRELYLTEGTLTMFDGFPFSEKIPYTYGEAKRLLKLAMKELRANRQLIKLGVDHRAAGRSAITGRGGSSVWDFLSLIDRPKHGLFTAYPHLTLSVQSVVLEVGLTIPNGVSRIVRTRLAALGVDGIRSLNAAMVRRARPFLAKGGSIQAYAVQRHYPTQRSQGITDARMVFKLETSLNGGRKGVKHQPEWCELFAELLRRKRSNIQFGYFIHLPWGTKELDRRDSLKLIASCWCAMEPLLNVVRARALTRMGPTRRSLQANRRYPQARRL